MTTSLIETIYLAAIIQGLFQIAILLSRRDGDRSTSRWLSLLVGLLTLSLWNLYSYKQELSSFWRLIDYDGWYSPLFWGPVLYLYTLSLTGQRRVFPAELFRHFSLGVFFFASGVFLGYLQSDGVISPKYLEIHQTVQLMTFFVQISLYIYASNQITVSYNRKLKDCYSDAESRNLIWLQRLIGIFALLIAIDMYITVPSVLRSVYPIPYLDYYLLAEAVSIYLIGYFYVMHTWQQPASNKPKYESSPLDSGSSKLLLDKLLRVMDDARPYRNPGLKLNELANSVDVHPHYLSQLINEQLNKNFYEFINGYRAELSKTLLLQQKDRNITDIAYEAGFNNRASFNKVFKGHTGMTPSQYRKNAFVELEMTSDSI